MRYRCDRCGRHWDDDAALENDLGCTKKCGGSLAEASWHAPATDRADIAPDLDFLPSLLAISIHDFATEPNPVLTLWHACDFVELALRLSVAIGLADLLQRGPIPDELTRALAPRLDEPGLGKWRGMAEAVVIQGRKASSLAVPEVADLVDLTLVPLLDGNKTNRTPETSLSALRNQLAHGGGVTRKVALRLLGIWRQPIATAMSALGWMADISFVAPQGSGLWRRLHGTSRLAPDWNPDNRIAASVSKLCPKGNEILLVRRDTILSIWPMAIFGIPRNADPDVPPATDAVAQIYVRRNALRPQYTPVGSEEMSQSEGDESDWAEFRRALGFERLGADAVSRGFRVRGFETEMRRDADRLVGRADEIRRVHEALDSTDTGVLWLTGPAGIGKSYLVAAVAATRLDNPPRGTLVLPWRFRAADSRCSRESFLHFAAERLRAWDGIEKTESGDEHAPSDREPPLLETVRDLTSRISEGRRVEILVDGLDEIAERDETFAHEVPLGIRSPRLLWLCAGRPERGLAKTFTPERARHVLPEEEFPNGLPPMNPGDIRTLLLEKIGPLRRKLLAGDREEEDAVVNPFIDRVAKAAHGLPLYVTYVIGDILGGRLRSFDEAEALRLPPSLETYYEELLQRCRVGSLHQVMTPIVATLAIAKEAMSAEALHALLARRTLVTDSPEGRALVRNGLAAVASMLRLSQTSEGEVGYTLYHHSLRQHFVTSEAIREAVATARIAIADAALDWERMADTPAGRYLFRSGVEHLVEDGRSNEALALLTSFTYLMSRLRTIGDPDGPPGISDNWSHLIRAGVELDPDSLIWEAFWREREHILRRGNDRWPSYKILLQLAVEHADDSPATIQAEGWLNAGNCNWLWLRNPRRVEHAGFDPCLRVFDGHTDAVNGAAILPDGRILSWSADYTLRLWSPDGSNLATLEGHSDDVMGASVLPNGRILSWSWDHTLRLWSADGFPLATLEGHSEDVRGAIAIAGGCILSWARDHTLRLWSPNGFPLATLDSHTDWVEGAAVLPDGRILSWARDPILRLWSPNGSPLATLEGHSWLVMGATVLPDGRILSWSGDRTLRLWSPDGSPVATLEGHAHIVDGATVLPDGRILSWSDDTLRLWSAGGSTLAALEGHSNRVMGASSLPDGRILSWSADHTLRLWSSDGSPLATLEGHCDYVEGAALFADGRILSWSRDRTLRLWSHNGAPLTTLEGHSGSVEGATVFPDGRILSWSRDGTMRLWSPDRPHSTMLEGHSDWVEGLTVLPDGTLRSWSRDGTMRLWSHNGSPRATLKFHSGPVWGSILLPDGRILSWSRDGTMRLWSCDEAPVVTFEGHSDSVEGARVLPDGRILSWSADQTLRLWSPDGAPLATLDGHSNWVRGAIVIRDGRILSWSWDHSLRLWSSDGAPLAALEGHSDHVQGATHLPDGRILSWSWDHTVRLWSSDGAPLAALEGHTGAIMGASLLPDGRILSWSRDRTLRLWSPDGSPQATLKGHATLVWQAILLPQDRILSWSGDSTLRLWSASGVPLDTWSRENAPDELILARHKCLGFDELIQAAVPLRSVSHGVSVGGSCWYATADVYPEAFLEDGSVVVSLRNGHVFCLKLQHRARRVSAAEAVDVARAYRQGEGR